MASLISAFGSELVGVTEVGYVGRLLVQATMPHSRPTTNEVERQNGDFYLSMMAPARVGLPYGTPPRHLLAWVTTEAVRTKNRVLELGDSYGEWLVALGVNRGGDDYRRYQKAAASLFGTSITCSRINDAGIALQGARVARQAQLWWDPKSPDQLGLWKSIVELDEDFFRALVDRPVPVDMAALRRLGRSPLAIDFYTWLTYRMSYLKKPATVPWAALHVQFGAEYGRERDFRARARRALLRVAEVYPEARVEVEVEGLRLTPSPSHVHKRLLSPSK
ncbi:MAG: replication protein RepA [Candidatus Dormibacteria bacterium]